MRPHLRFSITAIVWSFLIAAMVILAWRTKDLLSVPRKHFEQDAYIWQMKWKDPLRQSVRDNGGIVRAWRVLFVHIATDGHVRRPDVDANTLRASARPVVVVVRIEGQIEEFNIADLQSKVLSAFEQARTAGLNISGIEIDHDCASARLARYVQFLAIMRVALGGDTKLFITALPTWLASPILPSLLAQADEAILQVHAVTDPRQGLFNATQAMAWAEKFNAVTPHPFRLALPTYGSHVRYDSFGNLASVESEAPLTNGGHGGTELVVAPQDVQTLLNALSIRQPARLRGIAWFRLPTSDDGRAWHTNTWRALVTESPLRADLRITSRPAGSPGLFDILLVNRGETDAQVRDSIDVPDYCSMLDGVNGHQATGLATPSQQLKPTQTYLLKPQSERLIGWARCQHNPEHDLRISP